MSLYEFFKYQYKRTSYPLMDEHQFDELVAEIRAESAERIKELEAEVRVWHRRYIELKYPCEEKESGE